MTENQFYVLVTVLGAGLAGIGTAIRFSVGRVVKALDINSAAMLDNTKSNAVLSTKIDEIGKYVQRRSKLPSNVKDFIREEISGVHDAAVVIDQALREDDDTPVDGPQGKQPRAKSHPMGVPNVPAGGYAQHSGRKKDRP